jgi:hypothetical protein
MIHPHFSLPFLSIAALRSPNRTLFGLGDSFKVHDRERFVSDILPVYFKMRTFESFQRQLNLYGFRRVKSGPDKGSHSHKLFLKGKRNLAEMIQRRPQRKKTRRKTTPPHHGGDECLNNSTNPVSEWPGMVENGAGNALKDWSFNGKTASPAYTTNEGGGESLNLQPIFDYFERPGSYRFPSDQLPISLLPSANDYYSIDLEPTHLP